VKLSALAGLICCAALLGSPAAAQAQAPIPTTGTTLTGGAFTPTSFAFFGNLTSTNPNCLAGRTLKLTFIYASGPKLVDTGVSSTNGYWAVAGDPTGASGARLRVTKKTFGSKKHPRTCAAASIVLAV
jgi:hypothetical protein